MPIIQDVNDFNLNEDEVISLKIALRRSINDHGYDLNGVNIKKGYTVHPNSHIGTMVSLYRRFERILLGHK